MLQVLGFKSLDELTSENVPKSIQKKPLRMHGEKSEIQVLGELKKTLSKNKTYTSLIGMGYYNTVLPNVILRNLLENPGWYTSYTPYQAEISQGRLESLLNFQTMIVDLTKMDISNASLLDEATAAAEAMNVAFGHFKKKKPIFYVSTSVHPQTLAVVKTRAQMVGIQVETFEEAKVVSSPSILNQALPKISDACGVLVQYPDTKGQILDYSAFSKEIHSSGSLFVTATDLLALTVLKAPGEFGADIAFGSAQRFGVPMGYGGPHAAFFAVKDAFKRFLPGRLIGVSKDSNGQSAYRMTLQTREQHIRRETATSNICTAQALLANIAANYCVYHGPKGVKAIAERVHFLTRTLAEGLKKLGFKLETETYFDTLTVTLSSSKEADDVVSALLSNQINVRRTNTTQIGISLDELCGENEINQLLQGFSVVKGSKPLLASSLSVGSSPSFGSLGRESEYLTHPVFNTHHSETELLRYLKKLENRDLSLANCMIPLGSCTMKLNATTEMIPVTWPEVSGLHPFVPLEQAGGYLEMFNTLSKNLAEITGFHKVSLQPNSGAQGEFAGLAVIRAYLDANGGSKRNVCLIPVSAHGTNPASAAMVGMKIVPVKSDSNGNVDVSDLEAKAKEHAADLACLMITYPSTHGVFEEPIKKIVETIHKNGGLVYMDGANMNSQVGLCSPGEIGADVCHLNLHKTFCIPHGGGGPGMGPIGVNEKLAPYLPTHPVVNMGDFGGVQGKGIGPISAAPFGSASILPISHVYIELMGGEGLKKATQMAILNANYMARKLSKHYNVLYSKNGLVAHEFILDLRPFDKFISAEDIAKRLIDYGFHAPTMSWPIPGTLMVEPTESEPKAELDRFIDAMISIRKEIQQIQDGIAQKGNNVLSNAPHTAAVITANEWNRPYSRQQAAYPVDSLKETKYWPPVGRLDNVYGDRNLVCTCPSVEEVVAGQS
eukprot:TRINITY_DN1493_c0_g1_i1.p1 TRINITY_DN1493_c0_g1~~TRINITY_DN1493_c0_g1_i1.p1  ORF type:complete len:1070 (-),score=270.73 TRINITY_DN1493_c0_g1_i1:50-2893(-)